MSQWCRCVVTLLAVLFMSHLVYSEDKKESVQIPTKCEVCKYLVAEITERLKKSGKTHDILQLQYSIDQVKEENRKKYRDSELRLIEALDDPPVCDEVLRYNVHAERSGSLRYAKGMSETMQTLHGLKDKGVKVELGIPYEMWDSPHAEITDMKRQCEQMKETFEEEIEDWYFNHQGTKSLADFLCKGTILQNDDHECLTEEMNIKGDTERLEGKSYKKKVKKKAKTKTKEPKMEL